MSTKVYEVIRQVAAVMAAEGIGKTEQNQQQHYKFRGIDAVYNTLAPVLADKGLVILPRFTERIVTERTSGAGKALFYVSVKAEFDFVAAEDGSSHTIHTFGEAMDSADKATNKAMSAAYKYACFQAFCIPTEGDNDADASHHEVNPTNKPAKTASKQPSQNTATKETVNRACDKFAAADVDGFIESNSGGKAKAFADLKSSAEFQWLFDKVNSGEVAKYINDLVPL